MKNLILYTKNFPTVKMLKLSSIESYEDFHEILSKYDDIFILNPKSIIDIFQAKIEDLIPFLDTFKKIANSFSISYLGMDTDENKEFGSFHNKIKIYLTNEELDLFIDSFGVSKRNTRDNIYKSFINNFIYQIIPEDLTPENFNLLTSKKIDECDIIKIVW